MADQTTAGGSNAADFQPPTDNPQSGVGGGVQPTTTNGSNVFNQPGINPQAFPKTDSLRVVTTNTTQTLTSSDSTAASSSAPGWSALTVVLVAAVVLLGGLVLMLRAAKPAGTVQEEIADTVVPKPIKTKTKKKPSANRRKKNTKKRNRK